MGTLYHRWKNFWTVWYLYLGRDEYLYRSVIALSKLIPVCVSKGILKTPMKDSSRAHTQTGDRPFESLSLCLPLKWN